MSPEDAPPSFGKRARTFLRDSAIAGIVAVVPLAVVWWVFERVVLSMDGVLRLVPGRVRAWRWEPPWMDAPIAVLETPGLGFLLSAAVIVLIGTLARGLFGRRIVAAIQRPILSMPILGTVYTAVRQLLEAVFSSQAQSFQRVVLAQFPHKGSYVLGFVTAQAWAGVNQAAGQNLACVFVPTTPNPTSGFFMMIPEDDLLPLAMNVEEAFKAIMSSGIVAPIDGGVLVGGDIQSMTVEVAPVKLDL
jgi:uncharacterized membrane protein